MVILAGDTRQLPPVVAGGGEAETCAASVLSSAFYRDNVRVCNLTKTMRNRDDPEFSKMVDNFGDGLCDVDHDGFTTISGVETETSIENAVDFVYPPEVLQDPVACSRRAIISLHNDSVDEINNSVLSRVPGETYTLQGRTLLDHEWLEGDLDDSFCMNGYLEQLAHGGVPAHTITLKKGIVVMLTRNISIDDRLTNGSKVLVVDIQPYTLLVKTLDTNKTHWIPRIIFKFVTSRGVEVKRIQFPIRLSFAVTTHRSQGTTLEKACFDLRRDAFAHGHVYVGLSRVRRSADLRILATADRIDHDGFAKVNNVVFKSLLPH